MKKYIILILGLFILGCSSTPAINNTTIVTRQEVIDDCYDKANTLYMIKQVANEYPKEVVKERIKASTEADGVPKEVINTIMNLIDYAYSAKGTPQEVAETYYYNCISNNNEI